MRKILVTSPTYSRFSNKPIELLNNAGYEVFFIKEASHDQILEAIPDAEAIIVGLETVDRDIIQAGKNLKVIGKHGVGLDNIDVVSAKSHGIEVVNAPGSNTEAVADFAVGLMLATARYIPYGSEALKNHKWPKLIGKSLWEATLGIIGLGAIGKSVALRAKGFNMKILAYDITWDENFIKENNIIKASLEDIYSSADFITLHLSLNDQTRNMITIDQLKLMKSNAIIINTARGGLINEKDLHHALSKKIIAGAGLDAFSVEPLENSPLLDLDNVVATPHIATYTQEALTKMSLIVTNRMLGKL
jgi:D-3-phosphoglycerate dehydrogenase